MKNLTSALLCLLNPKVWTIAQNLTELFNILYFFSLGKKKIPWDLLCARDKVDFLVLFHHYQF